VSEPSSRPAIELEHVSKRYVKYEDTPTLLGRALARRNKTKRSSLWAVRGVDLAVEPGETLGVLGRNGSGKSTMLRMLAGVTAPTEGVVRVRGRIAPLIEVGVGFHPELTGRENVYVNGTIIGLSQREIDDLFDSIVDFAELPDFIDTPVKFYSSGMFVRLGFAVAVAAQPDILLIDEVLAVGDLRFQMKCFERMSELKASGATVVLVTHNLQATRNMCDRTLVLHDGEQHFLGPTTEAISVYHELLASAPRGSAAVEAGPGPVRSITTALISEDGEAAAFVKTGDTVTFRTHIHVEKAIADPVYGLVISSDAGVLVYSDSTYGGERRPVAAGELVTCEARVDLSLVMGSYEARGVVAWGEGPDENMASRPTSFFISGRDLVGGTTDLEARFSVASSGAHQSG
jgi:ABC-type polysaccharide/polyol phosphate transport system ATPase subunit